MSNKIYKLETKLLNLQLQYLENLKLKIESE